VPTRIQQPHAQIGFPRQFQTQVHDLAAQFALALLSRCRPRGRAGTDLNSHRPFTRAAQSCQQLLSTGSRPWPCRCGIRLRDGSSFSLAVCSSCVRRRRSRIRVETDPGARISARGKRNWPLAPPHRRVLCLHSSLANWRRRSFCAFLRRCKYAGTVEPPRPTFAATMSGRYANSNADCCLLLIDNDHPALRASAVLK
jgi:hypothetical protein